MWKQNTRLQKIISQGQGVHTHTITMVYRLVREDKERINNNISPPPSTVSIDLASRFGVKASKS